MGPLWSLTLLTHGKCYATLKEYGLLKLRIRILSTPSWITLSIALIDAALSTIHAYRMHHGVSNDYNQPPNNNFSLTKSGWIDIYM